jgi:hypothetical protein
MPQRGSSVLWCSHGPRFLVLCHKRELALPPARVPRDGGGESSARRVGRAAGRRGLGRNRRQQFACRVWIGAAPACRATVEAKPEPRARWIRAPGTPGLRCKGRDSARMLKSRRPPARRGTAGAKPERKARSTHAAGVRGVGRERRFSPRSTAARMRTGVRRLVPGGRSAARSWMRIRVVEPRRPPACCGTAEAKPEREARCRPVWRPSRSLICERCVCK